MTSKSIDWDTLHRVLEQTRQRIEVDNVLTPEQEQQILHERAKRFSKSVSDPANQQADMHFLSFALGKEHYGIELEYVTLASKIANLTPLPGVPDFIAGMIQIHGNIICTLDLATMMGLEAITITDDSRVIVVEHDHMEVGLIVDAVNDIQIVPASAIQSSLPALTGKRAEYLKGITQQQLILLNIPLLLSNQHLVVNQDVN